jgi:hypothetical protein
MRPSNQNEILQGPHEWVTRPDGTRGYEPKVVIPPEEPKPEPAPAVTFDEITKPKAFGQ